MLRETKYINKIPVKKNMILKIEKVGGLTNFMQHNCWAKDAWETDGWAMNVKIKIIIKQVTN